MNRDEYNKLFHKVGLNRVAFKAVNDCDEEILVLVNAAIAAERKEWQGLTEPVAWMNESDMGRTDWKVWAHGKPTATIPLYTAPPQREWQGLTEAERLDILDAELTAQTTEHFALAQAIEAKLKEKNT